MKSQRNVSYKKHWKKLIETYGQLCYYCKDEIATTIDHVIPYSHDQDNSIENLVPACQLCNGIAGDKHFEYVEEKRQYILSRKKRSRSKRVICPNCLMPFEYRYHSPSLFLCAECYDEEYDTRFASKKKWVDWCEILYDSGISPEAHTMIRKFADIYRGVREKSMALISEYEIVIDNDPNFCPWISSSDAIIIEKAITSEKVDF